jgi:hypothetical protein
VLRWWREVGYVAAFYVCYSAVRNLFGSAAVSPRVAYDNALRVIDVERALGLYVEGAVQAAFLSWTGFIAAWNIFYGTAHFAVTGGVMVWLFLRHPTRYRLWRTTLACTTGLALVGFAAFPLMPPRLLPSIDPSFDFVDTLHTIGGLWSFESSPLRSVSNQYAAMPSLHIGWSLWSAGAVLPFARRWWARVAVVSYPLVTLFAIVVTANHFWLDAVGGALVVVVGHVVALAIVRPSSRRGPGTGPVAEDATVTSAPATGDGVAAGHAEGDADPWADVRAAVAGVDAPGALCAGRRRR